MRLKLAVQKSGRLNEETVKLIAECGIDLEGYRGNGCLRVQAGNFPIELLFLRDDDIPGYVADGVADAGIVGENVLQEKAREIALVDKLGFSRCRLSIAVPKAFEYRGIESLQGRSIATSYPRIVGSYLDEKGVKADLHEISGSVEIAPSIGLAEAICDIVGTGSTLEGNGLREVETILYSQAVLIARPQLESQKQAALDKLLFRMKAVRRAKSNKYILLNAPNESLDKIVSLLPGMKSPSVLPLAEPGWSSVHSVVNENEFWGIIESLREAGAQGILVVPIEKMVL